MTAACASGGARTCATSATRAAISSSMSSKNLRNAPLRRPGFCASTSLRSTIAVISASGTAALRPSICEAEINPAPIKAVRKRVIDFPGARSGPTDVRDMPREGNDTGL